MKVAITLELEPGEAAAIHRLCAKLGHDEALRYLYGHVPKPVRDDQAYEMVHACAAVQAALEEQHVGHFPWIETGRASG